MNLKISHKLRKPDIFVKEFKKSKIYFKYIYTYIHIHIYIYICLNLLIMCEQVWCVGLGQEKVV